MPNYEVVMINLGDKVKDPVSGFVGIVTSRTEYLYGCIRVCVAPPIDKDGKLRDTGVFDEPQLVVVKRGVIKRGANVTGGPRPVSSQSMPPMR